MTSKEHPNGTETGTSKQPQPNSEGYATSNPQIESHNSRWKSTSNKQHTQLESRHLSPTSLFQLQRIYGNRATINLLSPRLQRQAITLESGQLLPGSDSEDSVLFWNNLERNYTGQNYYVILRQISLILEKRWRKGKASDWDRAILGEVSRKFSNTTNYTYYPPLNVEETMKAKTLLVGNTATERDTPIDTKDIDLSILEPIASLLSKYVRENLKPIQKADNTEIDISANSSYGAILKRAIAVITEKYGLKMLHASLFEGADNTALENLSTANLHHSTERWENAKEAQKQQATVDAVDWVMTNVPELVDLVKKVKEGKHVTSSLATVQSAYAKAMIEQPKYKEILKNLAEIRLRWGPITYGPHIYLEIGKKNPTIDEEWFYYKSLIHEALHSGEHPAFSHFLSKYIPKGLRSNIREGIVEHLTEKLWTEVMQQVQVHQPGLNNKPSQKPGDALSATGSRINTLKLEGTEYADQKTIIRKIIAAIQQGEQRLEAAYFYGNVETFLPKLI